MMQENIKKRLYTSSVLFLLFILIISHNFFLIFSLIIFFVISIIEFINLTSKIMRSKVFFYLSNLIFIIYISFLFILFFYFSNFIQLKIIIFSLLISCIASDIGGFIFGKFFKGPKLTKISPNKTYSGALGSIIFSTIFFSWAIFIFTEDFNYKILLIGIITSVASQFGDLFFSYMKREAKIKDTGNFLPGHGGILDRIDGILFGVPIGFYSLTVLL